MSATTKCRTCRDRFRPEEFVDCPDCGASYHESCLPYHAEYECPDCADGVGLAIGALEF